MQPCSSYLICATPRSGSTLLCEALTNTGIAGHPKEYFEALKDTALPRRPREYFETYEHSEIAELLGDYSRLDDEFVEPVIRGDSSYADYLARVIEEHTTPNGVFGAKVMWGYFDDFISNLRQIPGYGEMAVPALLSTVFPDLQYILVTRFDKVRQAVSLWKAIQTWTWKTEDSEQPAGKSSSAAHKLVFHFGAIDQLVQQIVAHEASWQQYFQECAIQPLTVVYEELAAAYEATTFKVLQYLNIPIPENLVLAERRMKKQADAQSEEWVQRYCHLKQEQE
jgi:trehalose 2-sulfotransferase